MHWYFIHSTQFSLSIIRKWHFGIFRTHELIYRQNGFAMNVLWIPRETYAVDSYPRVTVVYHCVPRTLTRASPTFRMTNKIARARNAHLVCSCYLSAMSACLPTIHASIALIHRTRTKLAAIHLYVLMHWIINVIFFYESCVVHSCIGVFCFFFFAHEAWAQCTNNFHSECHHIICVCEFCVLR